MSSWLAEVTRPDNRIRTTGQGFHALPSPVSAALWARRVLLSKHPLGVPSGILPGPVVVAPAGEIVGKCNAVHNGGVLWVAVAGRLFGDCDGGKSDLLRGVASRNDAIGKPVSCGPMLVMDERKRFVSVNRMDTGADTGKKFGQGFFHGVVWFVVSCSGPVLAAR